MNEVIFKECAESVLAERLAQVKENYKKIYGDNWEPMWKNMGKEKSARLAKRLATDSELDILKLYNHVMSLR